MSCCARTSAPCPRADRGRFSGAAAEGALAYSRLGLLMHPALVNGAAGLVSTRDGEPFSVGGFTVRDQRIVAIDILADPARLGRLDLAVLDD